MNEGKKRALQLLKTARGQTTAIINMIENDRYCIDISSQILAANSLLKKANLEILRSHIEECVKDAMLKDQEEEKIDEIMGILNKYMK